MVKIAFNSALAQKALGKDVLAAEKSRIAPDAADRPSTQLFCRGRTVNGIRARSDPELAAAPAGSEGSTGRCLLTLLGIAFILSGLIVGGACLYRYFTPKRLSAAASDEQTAPVQDGISERLYHGAMQFSDVSTGAGGESQPYYLPRVEEEVEISDSMAKLTAYLDLTLRTCFVIPLNTSVVLPPQDLIDLFSQLMSGSYRSYLVHEDLVVTERIDDVKPLGFYIRRLCDGKETYRMQRRSTLPGVDGLHGSNRRLVAWRHPQALRGRLFHHPPLREQVCDGDQDLQGLMGTHVHRSGSERERERESVEPYVGESE
ncbi:hypothetical protein FQN60_009873 [Etheostoma spectabile]|uniref:Integral membrane protein 2 n=1 Tax=Etheostoma spectabile TaxID=54343 RepID=A0A5J5D1B4_9PERO|nr:hypothetical protein FQN60_009873 [Etheostoma spectabile]